MTAHARRGPAPTADPVSSAHQNAATGHDRTSTAPEDAQAVTETVRLSPMGDGPTSTPRQAREAVVRLTGGVVDVAAALVDRLGDTVADEVAAAVRVMLHHEDGGYPSTTWRVRWRAPWWSATSSTRSRTFTRHADAVRFFDKCQRAGHTAEMSRAVRSPWRVTRDAPWSGGGL